MNESDFIRALHNKLPARIYRWKISDRFSAGAADAYYSSNKGDMWVEYKFYKSLPNRVRPKLSPLQIRWLNARYDEGRSVFVVVGSLTDCLIYRDKEWNNSKPKAQRITRAELIQWMVSRLA